MTDVGAEFLGEQPDTAAEHVVEGSLGESLYNYAALADDSTSAVRIRVDSASEYRYLDVPHTLSDVHVIETLGGQDLTGRSIQLWQAGTASAPLEGLARPLRTGGEYLIYTEPFFLEEGKPLSRWVVVAQGSWKQHDGAYVLDLATDDPDAVSTRGIAEGDLEGLADGRSTEPFEKLVWDLDPAPTTDALHAAVSRSWAE